MQPRQSVSFEDSFARARGEFEKGDLDAALKDVDLLAGRTANLGEDWLWRVRLLKSEILVWRGTSEDVFPLLSDPVPESLAKKDYAVRRLTFLGLAEGHAHNFDKSSQDLALAEKFALTDHPELLGEIYLARGSVLVDQGLYEKALHAYQVAFQKAREYQKPFLEANSAGSLGYALTWLERYDQAIDWYRTSLASSDSFGARATSAKTLGNLGWTYHEFGDLPNALTQFHNAEEASRLAGLELDRAYWRLSAGTVQFDLGSFRDAEADMTAALELLRQLHDSSILSECYENLALLAIQNGQFPLARERLNEAERYNSPNPDFKRAQYHQLLSAELAFRENQLDFAATQLTSLATDSRAPTSMRWEAQATLAQVHAAQRKFGLAEREFSLAIATITHARDAIEHEDFRLSFLSSAIRFYDEYVNFLLEQNRPLDALRIADRSRAQTLEQGLSLASGKPARPSADAASFRPQEIARRQNASLLFYWLGPNRSFVWVVTAQGVSLLPLPARSEIDAATAAYRKSFLAPRDPLEAGNLDGKKLYDVLVRPAEKLIPRNSRVVILPDGSLSGLNFETLIAADPQPHYWIEDVTISIASSLSLLARARRDSPPKSPNLLFFGEPQPTSKDFPPLADAAEEADAVLKHSREPRRTLFVGPRATPSNYLGSNPGSYSYIHFATHGTASITRPLESAIILSADTSGSYKLYARDIIQRPLKAYLVSISACNGTGDRVLAGEGLVGLSWAFLRAGAHNVVAGLWEVSTASAPPIFDGLYAGVTAGQDPATALRNAKLALIHSKGPQRRPFYWAPFQLYSGS
ncbi:MAG: hypothetical protein NVS9B14_00140 [Candidatus Acidiferrum sp.]